MRKYLVVILALGSLSAFAGNWGTVSRTVKIKSVYGVAEKKTLNDEVFKYVDYFFEIEAVGSSDLDSNGLKTLKLNSCDPKGTVDKWRSNEESDLRLVNALNANEEIFVNISALFNDNGTVDLHCIL